MKARAAIKRLRKHVDAFESGVKDDYRTRSNILHASPVLLDAITVALDFMEMARNELGIPQPGYPAPVANAADALRTGLAKIDQLKWGPG